MNSTCGCCTGTHVAVPVSEVNPPGLTALSYRTGTYATFLETMLARLSGVPGLTTRDPADPSIALLDAWAVVSDVLTFYQERIANEGYLPTALERRSVLELARLIGYRPRPGVAASVRLAFTVASGFEGTIPAGTRAQSVPGTGESPQFFETSVDLDARDTWNALAPRLARPQVVTPAMSADYELSHVADVIPTAADVIDTVYLDGLATGVRAGDALLFVFGDGTGEQYLRRVQSVDAQAAQARTEAILAPDPRYKAAAQLLLFEAKAQYLFPGSDIAARAVAIVENLRANISEKIPVSVGVGLIRAALPQIALQQSLADARGFTRVSATLHQLSLALRTIVTQSAFRIDNANLPAVTSLTPLGGQQLAASQLGRLDAILGSLTLARSVQPSSALRLSRSVAQSFTPQSDLAPRLLGALKPAAANGLYQAWTSVAMPESGVHVYAARVKASLFGASWTGPATVTQSQGTPGELQTGSATDITTGFTAPDIDSAWISLNPGTGTLSAIPLDAPYDQVAPGGWVAIDRPRLDGNDGVVGRTVTYHRITDARTTNVDSTTGLRGKVSLIAIDPPWLADANAAQIETAHASRAMLRETIVYAQAEELPLTDEPLDTDIEGDSIDLRDTYDGLEAGRWIIVSGTRTDIPGAAGITAAEAAMIAGVAQGSQAPGCVPFPYARPPLTAVNYVTAADANGDRLVVGQLDPAVRDLPQPDAAAFYDQRYCDQVELAPGFFANVYVPSAQERDGEFPSFDGMLVDPQTHVPFPGGRLPSHDGNGKNGFNAAGVGNEGDDPNANLVAVRISDDKLHTIVSLAGPLAYTYDRNTVTIYGNVVDATHGQTTGEVLGNGDASRTFASFALHQTPLTYLSAPTPSGTSSTLAVRVNELLWHEVPDFTQAAAGERKFVTREDDAQQTTVTFGNGEHGARLPTGTGNVKAVYRYGLGKAGNVDAAQISQLATHPLGVQAVLNPLPATGGGDPDRIDQARANAPMAVMALDRLVSVRDYADFARTYAGIGKATAAKLSDGRKQVVHVTVAGGDDIPIDPGSDLYRNLVTSLQSFGDPYQPIAVGVRRVRLIVMSAAVGLQPDYAWEDVEPRVRAALLALFAFDARDLGQTAFLSEAVRAVQDAAGVAYVNVTTFGGVGEDVTASQLAALGATLGLKPYVQAEYARVDPAAAPGSPGRIVPAELVFMTPDIADTLILSEAG